jgi:hypothetical protein
VGKPESETLPTGKVQVGEVINPTTGAEGIEGWAFIRTLPDGTEMQFAELVTVNV